jgi:hypothetical protein
VTGLRSTTIFTCQNSTLPEFVSNEARTIWQVKIVVDRNQVIMEGDEEEEIDLKDVNIEDIKIRFNPEQHMLLEDAKRIKRDAVVGDEIIFPLENKADFGRIAAQTAKQVIIQKIREAEKVSVLGEYG